MVLRKLMGLLACIAILGFATVAMAADTPVLIAAAVGSVTAAYDRTTVGVMR